MRDSTYWTILLLLAYLQSVYGLYGPNVCTEQQNYTMTTRVKYQQPVAIKTYKWCLGFPPRCSSTHIEMKEKWKVQTAVRTKAIEKCCEGFEEDEGRCVPKCPAGFTGDLCDQGCPLEKWGPSCTEDCECPKNAICNAKNGSCVCLNGWYGSSCDMPLFPATRMPYPRVDKEILKNTNLFDWNPPTMADVQAENHPTYRTFVSTKAPELTSMTTSTMTINNKFINISQFTSEATSTKKNIPTTISFKQLDTTTMSKELSKDEVTDNTSKSETTEKITTFATKSSQVESAKIDIKIAIPIQNTTLFTAIEPVDIKWESDKATENIKDMINSTVSSVIVNTTVNNTSNISNTTVKNAKIENITESTDSKPVTLNSENVLKSQIESPNIVKLAATTVAPEKTTTQNVTQIIVNESTTTSTISKISTSTTTKKRLVKHQKSESDILNITIGSKNESGSKIFKTITLPPIINTTLKVPHQKSKVLYESKMITIPVRVIVESEKSPSNIYLRKSVNGSTADSKKTNKFVTYSPMYTLDIQTEETKHVLTEPEQITSIAGSDDDFDRPENLLSVLTISIGVMLIIILTATIIVLVTRYRQIKADKINNFEMEHVQSMMNVSEEEVQSGYLRSVFHSPIPDLPSQIIKITNPVFFTPYVEPTLSRPVSPALMESFRDILECHYDHPKPPRPTSTPVKTQIADYQVPPSIYQHLNTFKSCIEDANQIKSTSFSLPVTDAAINVLKMEHQNNQTTSLENKEPVYDEIPSWISANPKNLNRSMYSNEEAITEL